MFSNHLEEYMWKLLKLAAFVKAPKAMFALRHPIRAVKLGAALYVGRTLYRRIRDWADNQSEEGLPLTR